MGYTASEDYRVASWLTVFVNVALAGGNQLTIYTG